MRFCNLKLKFINLTVYQYIAENNPDAAYVVCKQYGYYDIKDISQLAQCLELIVGQDGEEGLAKVMETHPDKETLLELFKKKQDDIVEVVIPTTQEQPAPPKSEPIIQAAPIQDNMRNADGNSMLVNTTNLYILIGATVVAFAIIVSRNKS